MMIISKEDITNPITSAHGEIVYELVGRAPDHGGVTRHSLAQIVIPPGKASHVHYHKISEETYYILSGHARLVVDGHDRLITSGQACLIKPGQVHQIFNTGEGDLEFLAVCAPAWYAQDSYDAV